MKAGKANSHLKRAL